MTALMRCRLHFGLWLFVCFVSAGSVFAQFPGASAAGEGEAGNPVAQASATPSALPAGYASPRTTMATFLEQMNRVESRPQDAAAWEQVFAAMEISAASGESARREVAWQLLGVFNALGRVDPEAMLPGMAQVADEQLERFEFFPSNPFAAAKLLFGPALAKAGEPPAKVLLVKLEDGWKFAEPTLANVTKLFTWAEPLGVNHGSDVADFSRSVAMRQWIPSTLQGRFFLGIELWQWAGLAVVLFLALAIDLIAQILLRSMVPKLLGRYLPRPEVDLMAAAARPMGMVAGALVYIALVQLLGIGGVGLEILVVAGRVFLVATATWTAWAWADLLSGMFLTRAENTASSIDDMVVPLLRKTAKLFIVAMGLIYLAEAFEIELLPMLASFGIAGLAISFAAQDMVKNLFGGLTIFMDRPFKVGERISYEGYDGVVEEIGFRITRMRTLTGHLVTLPNGGITNQPVENIGRRPYIRRLLNVTVTYDTPLEKIEQGVQILRDILEEPEIAEPIHGSFRGNEMPPRVYFNEYNDASLNIFVMYWHFPPDWWQYMEHGHKVNLRIFEEFEKAGIEFAFPTQTLYLAGDPKRELVVRHLGADLKPEGEG